MVLHGQTLMVPAGMPTPDHPGDKWAQDVATAFSATAVDAPLAAALRDSVGGAVDDALAASLEAVAGRACTVIDPATAREGRVAAGRVLLVAGGHAALFDDGVSRKHAHAVLVSRCGVVRCGRAILSVESETRRFARTLDAASDQLMRVGAPPPRPAAVKDAFQRRVAAGAAPNAAAAAALLDVQTRYAAAASTAAALRAALDGPLRETMTALQPLLAMAPGGATGFSDLESALSQATDDLSLYAARVDAPTDSVEGTGDTATAAASQMQTMAQLIAPAVAPVLTETLTAFEAARASAAAPERRAALAGACEELAACVDGTAHAAWAPHLLRVATALRNASAVAPADITAIRAIRPEPMLDLLAPRPPPHGALLGALAAGGSTASPVVARDLSAACVDDLAALDAEATCLAESLVGGDVTVCAHSSMLGNTPNDSSKDAERVQNLLAAGFGYAYGGGNKQGDGLVALAAQLGSTRSTIGLQSDSFFPPVPTDLRRALKKRRGDLRRQLRRATKAGISCSLRLNTLPIDRVVAALGARHDGALGCWASSKRAVALYETLREEGKLLVFELWEGESCCALDVAHAAGAGVYVATRCVDRGSHIGSPGFLLAFATCGWLQRQGAACWDLGAVDASRQMAYKRALAPCVDRVRALDAHRRARDAASVGIDSTPRVLVAEISEGDLFEAPSPC